MVRIVSLESGSCFVQEVEDAQLQKLYPKMQVDVWPASFAS